MNHCRSRILSCSLFICFAVSVQLSFPGILQAQAGNQTISFTSNSVELVFTPPFRSGFNSKNPLFTELPRLNLLTNLLENYIQYLRKLQKVATGTSLSLLYAPDLPPESWDNNSRFIRISELGLNHILQQVNTRLKEAGGTEASYLLDSADSLFSIPDQYPRNTSKIAIRTELVNHSSFQISLEPDTDFCVLDENRVITARPYKRTNRLFLMTDQDDVCSSAMVLDQSRIWYSNLKSSYRGEFISFTDGMFPKFLNLQKTEPVNIFSDKDTILSDLQWSPASNHFAGLVMNTSTQQREFFIYDADKEQRIRLANENELQSNYYNPHIYWSPAGKHIILLSPRSVCIVDVESKRVFPNVVRLANEVSELIWSNDGKSFALVEVVGQARDRYAFDDLDFRKSILRRYMIKKDFAVTEDHAQRTESRNTIKLLSFWTMDRILYLEGRLMSKRLNTPFWDLSNSFKAYLTPTPSTSAPREGGESTGVSSRVALPMQFLYVFRNLDSKNSNIYDAGFAHSNFLFADKFANIWFIGLRKPSEILQQKNIYNHRINPYPFPESNYSVFSEYPPQKMERLLKFLQDYQLRQIKFNSGISRIFMLANFSGPLNLWSGDLQKLVEGLNIQDN